MQYTKQHATVIGAGFGGMASALRLRAKGYAVTLLEHGDQLGGRARCFKQDGFTFDAGPTVITAPSLIEELFTLFNKKMSDYVTLKPLEHWYRYLFPDNTYFDYVADLDIRLKNIAGIDPADADGYIKLRSLAKEIFDIGFTKLSDKPFNSIAFMLKQAPDLLRLKSYRTVYQAVSKCLQSEKLRRVFTTQPLLVGGNPFQTTSIYLLILELEHKYGCHFTMGGTNQLINALAKLMQEVGIQVQMNATVTSIETENQEVKSVTINSRIKHDTSLVVYNGDPAYAYHHLLPATARKYWPKFRLNSLAYSMGLVVYYFGTNRKYNDLKLHTIIYGNSYKELLDDIFNKHKLNRDLSLYLYRPTAIDSSLAPDGGDAFYVLAPVPNLQSGHNWKIESESFKNHLISILEKRCMPNLSKHIISDKIVTPDYFESELLSKHGAGFSIQPIFRQSAYFRFHNQAQDVSGLYFVGAGTHPGAGVPGVLSSARLVADLIKEPDYATV